METNTDPNTDENVLRQTLMREKEMKKGGHGSYQFFKEILQQNELMGKNGSKDDITSDIEISNQETTNHDQANSGTESSVLNGQHNSLPKSNTGNHNDFEDAGLPPNHEMLNFANDQNPTSPTQAHTTSDAPIILTHNTQASDHRGPVTSTENSNAIKANNLDPKTDPEENQSGSVELIGPPSRLDRLRPLLLRGSIFGHKKSK